MGLCRQMHHGVGAVAREDVRKTRRVADVQMDESVARILRHGRQGFQIAGVSQLVEVDDRVAAVADQVPDQGRADESGAAGDEDLHSRLMKTRLLRE